MCQPFFPKNGLIINFARQLSRDPIEEADDKNLFGFLRNNPVDLIDKDGRLKFEGCPLLAEQRLRLGIAKACDKISHSYQVACCMGFGAGKGESIGSEAHRKLRKLCLNRDFTVACEPVPPSHIPFGCAKGSAKDQKITVYNDFIVKNGCGIGFDCGMMHEMLHLAGYLHPPEDTYDTLFNTLHHCLGCPRYQ